MQFERVSDGGGPPGAPITAELPGGSVVLIPTRLQDGTVLTEGQALEAWRKGGGDLGRFESLQQAIAFARLVAGGSVP